MEIRIEVPCECLGTAFQVSEILRVERRALSFFDNKVFNLYIIVKRDAEELFHLFSFQDYGKMETAYQQLSAILKAELAGENTILLNPESLLF
ncbi:hypothetical protein [Pontibacter harenae]|uniref:hypothetical protein n=1 Tax=Pontibacter harenae TaxID=2894083 RepID=UPI001E2ECA9A|nr:hypothetical protein [Pontibacter harenae]MCC9166006.1 hypothetical protein [Pontibacter harenae]